MFQAIAGGILGGVSWGIIGFVNKKAPKGNEVSFEWKKFAKSVVIGAVLGAYAGYSGSTIDVVSTGAALAPATAIAEKIVNIVWKLLNRAV